MLDFLGIGAQKAATTWLYEHLGRHPDIHFPAGKEIHFWDQQRHRGLDWYRGLFEGATLGVKGEITPAYALLDQTVITEIRAMNPDMRIIYLMRNPIDRAWSSALMALRRAEMTFDEASDQWFIDHFRSAGSLERGDYEASIRRWRAVFPERQIWLGRYDEVKENPRGMLKDICCHIGVDSDRYSSMEADLLSRRVFSGGCQSIRPQLRELLEALYVPKIKDLGRYLGWDLSAWIGPVS